MQRPVDTSLADILSKKGPFTGFEDKTALEDKKGLTVFKLKRSTAFPFHCEALPPKGRLAKIC